MDNRDNLNVTHAFNRLMELAEAMRAAGFDEEYLDAIGIANYVLIRMIVKGIDVHPEWLK